MIDALLYSVRDAIRAANIGYGKAECEIMDGPEPPPKCGNYFASIHDGYVRNNSSSSDNNLDERFGFTITLTMRITISPDRAGDQLIYRNLVRDQARKKGFYAKADELRSLLHMNWNVVVVTGKNPPSANDNITDWGTGTVYGFCEPMRWRGMEFPKLVNGAAWFGDNVDAEGVAGIKAALSFDDARRIQPITAASGPSL